HHLCQGQASIRRRKGASTMRAESIKGMAVVSIADASKLGRVVDVLFDVKQRRAAALAVQGPEQRLILPFDRIANIGSDAVTVPGVDALQVGSMRGAVAEMEPSAELIGRKVVDDAGTLLGTVSSIEFDPKDGQISELGVHQGGVLGIGGTTSNLPASTIQSIGSELVVVA